ncbi:Uncharacterised protein [Streptococcus pneumoniae]|nr:Uncharacterised protein [Streptococcus pneumoniae]
MVSNLHQNDKINQLISDYKQNMKAFYITIEKFIRNDESLKMMKALSVILQRLFQVVPR